METNESLSPINQLDKNFNEYSLAYLRLTGKARELANKTQASEKLDSDWQTQIQESMTDLRPFFKETGLKVVTNFINQEQETQKWWEDFDEREKHGLLEKLGVAGDKASIERIAGGLAVVLSPKDFQRLAATRMFKDGEIVTDPELISNQLKMTPEAGFLVDQKDIPQDLDLPKGARLCFVLKSGFKSQKRNYVNQAIFHEENEIIGEIIDEAILNDSRVKKLDNLAETVDLKNLVGEEFYQEVLTPVLHDLASHLAEGNTNISLGAMGITPEDKGKYPEGINFIQGIITGVKKQLEDEKRSPLDLGVIVQGGTLRPENLLKYLHQEENFEDILKKTEINDKDFRGISFDSEKKGRFVFNTATLRPGDILTLDNIDYVIKRPIGQGAFGVVYEASTNNGKKVAVKEIIFEAPQALFASGATAGALFEGFINKQTDPDNPDPFILIDQLKSYLRPQPEDKHFSQHEFARNYLQYLDDYLKDNLTPNVRQYLNSGQDKLCFSRFDRHTGESIVYHKLQKQDIIKTLKQAIINFPSSAGSLRDTLGTAVGMFTRESEVLHTLYGIPGIAGSLGLVQSRIYEEANPRYDCFYMIQDFAEGEDLRDYLQNHQWNLQEKIDFAISFLKTLGEVHKKGIIHKDIKPENIKVDQQGKAVIMDFGIAKSRLSEMAAADKLGIRKGTTQMGTIVYNSLEHIVGRTDARSDIYSTGMLLFEILTGEDVQQTMEQFGPAGIKERRRYVENKLSQKDIRGQRVYPLDLQQIILKAIEEKPADRFQSAEEMVVALESSLKVINDKQKRVVFNSPDSDIPCYWNPVEQLKAIEAKRILGKDFLGIEAVRNMEFELRNLGVDISFDLDILGDLQSVPEIPYSFKDLEIAKQNGEMLVLRAQTMEVRRNGERVTIANFREIFSKDPLGLKYSLFDPNFWYKNEQFANTMEIKLGWSLVKKEVLAGSLDTTWDYQEQLLRQYGDDLKKLGADHFYVKRRTAMEATWDTILYYINTGNSLLVACDWGQSSILNKKVYAGHFLLNGFGIYCSSPNNKDGLVGVCPCR